MPAKILIVDDQRDILDSMTTLVRKMGYGVKTADNGKQAFELLHREKFDLALVDILMPEMSGRELVELIRADPQLKKMKVAFLTVVELGKAGVSSIKKLKPVEYFQKPIDVPDFRRRLKKILPLRRENL